MNTCIHCGFPTSDGASFCCACEWMHLGLSPEIEKRAVIAAQFMLDAYQQHFKVTTVEEVHQLMVDLMYGSEKDELVMNCVGMLRKVLEVAVEEELQARGIEIVPKELRL